MASKGQCILQTVDEHMNPMTGMWDEDTTSNIFLLVDVERILRISLGARLGADFVASHKTHAYSFSSRSAYYVESENQFANRVKNDDVGPLSNNLV